MSDKPERYQEPPDDEEPLEAEPEDTEEQAEPEEEQEQQRTPLSQTLGFGAGTFLAAGMVDLLAHLGPTGLVVGGIAAYVASRHGPDLFERAREALPSPPAREAERQSRYSPQRRPGKQRAGGRSVLDRALGRFPEEEEEVDVPGAHDDEDTVIVDEEDEPSPEPQTRRWHGAFQTTDMLELAANLRVHKHDLAGKAIFICGMRRQGKTTLGALLAEQLGKHYLPLFIPDLEGDYLSLAQVLPRAVIAGHSCAASQYWGAQYAALDSVQAAHQLGYDILEQGYQAVLDLSSYATLDQGVAIQINIIRGLFHWANRHPDKRVPCHVFLDEAQRYLPQTLSDSVILDRAVLSMLLKCYMDILAIGGKRGIAPVILTQRFAQVNNKIMAQSEVFFLLRQTHDTDLKRCMEYVQEEVATREQIARFRAGQGIYIAADGSQLVTQFSGRQSSGRRSSTPQPEAAYRYASMPMHRPSMTAAEAVPTPEQSIRRVTIPPPQAAGAPHAEVVQPIPFARPETEMVEVAGVKITRKQKLAYDLHVAGNTTITSLATAMTQNGAYGTVDNNVAYRLRNELAALGLIHLPRRNKA